MTTCNCSLAGTGACSHCHNSPRYGRVHLTDLQGCKKITEKYENGQLVERVIEGVGPTGSYDFKYDTGPAVDFTTYPKKAGDSHGS